MRVTSRMTLALMLTGACAAMAQSPGGGGAEGGVSPPFELGPGVVVSPERAVVYSMRPEGGIEAVRVGSGETIWETTEVAKPLTIVGHRLVVQERSENKAGALPIAFLDVESGARLPAAVEVPLPPGVRALIDQGLGESFSARAWMKEGDLAIAWSYLRQNVTGTAPPPDAKPLAAQEQAAVRVGLGSGRVEPLPVGAAETEPALPPEVQALVDSGDLSRAPWRIGGLLSAVVDQPAGRGERRVALKRWDAATGAPLAPVQLFEGRLVAQLPSSDHRHLLVVSRAADGSDPWNRYRWSIFSLASGQRIGELPSHQSADRFAVLGTLLLHLARPYGRRVEGKWIERPFRLEAFDLRRGLTLWTRALRDTAYRGPHPPTSGPGAGASVPRP